MGRVKSANSNAMENNNKKNKNGFPKVSTFAQMEKEEMEKAKFKK